MCIGQRNAATRFVAESDYTCVYAVQGDAPPSVKFKHQFAQHELWAGLLLGQARVHHLLQERGQPARCCEGIAARSSAGVCCLPLL